MTTIDKMKKQLSTLLAAVFFAGTFGGNVVAANQVTVDTSKIKQLKYDPYFVEALPLGAPEWMARIAADPSGVNFKEVQLVWQNVQYVKKAFISESQLVTLIEDLIKSGNLTLNVLIVK